MRKIILSLVSLLLPYAAFAAPVSPALQKKIDAIVALAPMKGTRAEYQEYTSFYFSSGTSFDPAVERDVHYLNVVGVISQGEFHPLMIHTVSERWRKSAQGWDMGQRLKQVTLNGVIHGTSAHILSFNEHGRLLDRTSFPRPTLDVDNAEFAADIEQWWSELVLK